MSIQASGIQVHLGLAYDAVPFNNPPPPLPISPLVSSSRGLEEHSEAWPLSCYYTIWCLLQLTLVKPGEACQPCHHCPFLRVPTLPAYARSGWHPSNDLLPLCQRRMRCDRRVRASIVSVKTRGKKGIKFLRERICVFVLIFLSELASLHKPHNLWEYWKVK